MPNSIFDLVTANAIASYYETLATNRIPYLGEGLFPSSKRGGLKLEWIKGYDSLPIALQPSAFDAKPLLRDREGVSIESTRMPFFRESMRLGEADRQELLMFAGAQNNAYAQNIIKRLFDDTVGLIDGANIVPEVMRMSLLTDGAFVIGSEGDSGQSVNYSYNYDPNDKWKAKNFRSLKGTSKWSDHANSNPIADIQEMKKEAKRRGIELTRAVVGYNTWLDIYENHKVRLGMYPLQNTAQNIITSEQAVKEFVESLTGVRIQVYDKLYKGTDRTDQFFYPTHGQMTLLPSATLGSTWYGTTPEEADLMSGNTLADVRVVNTGVAVSTMKEALPVNIINWVSEIVLPSFEQMETVFNIKY